MKVSAAWLWLAGLAASLLMAAAAVSLGLPSSEDLFHLHGADYWSAQLDSSDRAARRQAQEELKNGGVSAMGVLRAMLRDSRASIRQEALGLIESVGAPAVPALIHTLSDDAPLARQFAARAIGRIVPDSAEALQALITALGDKEAPVVWDAAFSLAAFHERAAPASDALARALAHSDSLIRITAADALGSIGAKASGAIPALIRGLDDRDGGVRRAAAQAIGKIGAPAAVAAVPRLILSAQQDDQYVRMSAATALGEIGPRASPALGTLRAVSADPAVRTEALWAIAKITGATTPPSQAESAPAADNNNPASRTPTVVKPGEWPMLGGGPDRNAVRADARLPDHWNVETGENIVWKAKLGDRTFTGPVVSGGRVFIGADNTVPRDPSHREECGVLMAFDAASGRFLWQDVAPYLADRGLFYFLQPYTTSTPLVEGERLYYMTAQAQLRCLDVNGFMDGKNDGPYLSETTIGPQAADIIWELDLGAELGVYPHEAPNCSVVSVGNLLLVCTSNGVDAAHTGIPAPRAPSFIGVDKTTGKVVWQVVGPSPRVLHGQWSSPSAASVGDKTIAFFGGGDGWLYALDALTGDEVWRYDGNPKNSIYRSSSDVAGAPSRNSIVACPVYHEGRVYLAMGEDPTHGDGQGRLHAIRVDGRGDITETGAVWQYTDLHRTIGSPIIQNGLLFVADNYGQVHCVDLETGKRLWAHDQLARIWGSVTLAGDRLYVGDEDGTVVIYRAGPKEEVIAQNEMPAPVRGAPAIAGDTLYLATSQNLYAIRAGGAPTTH